MQIASFWGVLKVFFVSVRAWVKPYSAARMDIAAGNKKVFIGDLSGLFDSEMSRCLSRCFEAVLSSASKHDSTDHMRQYACQLKRMRHWHACIAVIRCGNIQRMIGVSLASIAVHVPEFQRACYDFAAGAFRDSQGTPLSNEML